MLILNLLKNNIMNKLLFILSLPSVFSYPFKGYINLSIAISVISSLIGAWLFCNLGLDWLYQLSFLIILFLIMD
jgi:uncharacterized membrane protein YfcA